MSSDLEFIGLDEYEQELVIDETEEEDTDLDFAMF
jgi:hypothetical protein